MDNDELSGARERGDQFQDESYLEPSNTEKRNASERARNARRMFEPMVQLAPFGAASISLLLKLLVDRTRSQAWSVHRQQAHARALIELSTDHYYSDEELAILVAFVH